MSTLDIAPNTENDGGSKPVSFRLYPDEIAKVEHYAKLDHRTRASFLRVKLMQILAEHEKQLETTTA